MRAREGSNIEALEKKSTHLENELKELEAKHTSAMTRLAELIKGIKSLEKLGIDKVCKLSTFIRECEELGYSVDKLAELVRLVDRKSLIEKQIITLKRRFAVLNRKVRRGEGEMLDMMAKKRALLTTSRILKSRTTIIACAYCSRPITVPVPNALQLSDSMKKGLVYPTKCHYCGYTNQINPRDILASIGWNVLTA